MPRVEPLPREELGEFEPFFETIEQVMGFVPNSMLTLGRAPDLLRAFSGLSGAVLGTTSLPPTLRQLIALVASQSAGCRYCQAHSSHGAEMMGVDEEKIAAAFEFETSPLFDEKERAVLRVARDAACVPNRTTDAQFDDLKAHLDEREIVEIVAVISLFGWLNRWNDTLATTLEAGPLAFAESTLARSGWEVGRHGAS
ncbi:MAG: fusion protein [Deltaproteobacteria bacterium]|nr:fusion protein [Deltaproteobacteria bacterium]